MRTNLAPTCAPPQFLITTWSGGPATFTVGPDFVHTLSLEAPTMCVTSWQEDCAPSGLPYCVAGDYGECPPLGYDD